MPTVPKKIPDKIGWYAARQAAWTSGATSIGLTSGQMTTMSGYITSASTAWDNHVAAQQAAKDATLALYQAVNTMGDYGSILIQAIRAKATQVGGDSVYIAASVPPPATPTPMGPPGKPTDLTVELDETGVLNLKWKCPNPAGASGTWYRVYRRIGGDGEFTYLGDSGQKAFEDATLPAGSSQVTYQIQGARTTGGGPWAQFNVNFGVGSGSGTGFKARVTETAPSKIAA